jgi:hypothetical protein
MLTNPQHLSDVRRLLVRVLVVFSTFMALLIGQVSIGSQAQANLAGPNTRYCDMNTYIEPIGGGGGFCPPEFQNCVEGHCDRIGGGDIIVAGGGGGPTWRAVERTTVTHPVYTYWPGNLPHDRCNRTDFLADTDVDPVLAQEYVNIPTRNFKSRRSCSRTPKQDGTLLGYAWKITTEWQFEAQT